jgi:hypothetical protein
MKNLKKLVTMAAAFVMATSIFTGCSYEGKSLSDAVSKTQKITSSESKTEIGLRFSAENLSTEEQEGVSKVTPMINGSKITMNTKMNKDANDTAAKMQADVAMQFGDKPINMQVWAEANGNNGFKEIIKVPDTETAKIGGKQYVVLDSSKMIGTKNINTDLEKTSQDMQKKLTEIIANNMTSFDPGFKLITDKGNENISLPDGEKSVHVYEVKLDDTNFKSLIKNTSNNMVNNKDLKDLLKDYLTTVTKMSAANETEANAKQAEIDKAFADFEKGLPEFSTKMNKVLNSFDKVTLVGEKGIVIDYAVDANGYVVNEKGNIDLVFDAPKFIAAVQESNGTSTQNKLTGVYKLGIDFNTNNYNINKNVEVKLPEVSSENSVEFQDLISKTKVK